MAIESAILARATAAPKIVYGLIDGPWQTPTASPKKAGLIELDGEDVVPPPDDSGELPDATATTPACEKFVNVVPPSCTDTGEFRRAYSGPGYSYAFARVTLPADNPGMKNISGSNGDAGFIYLEGWPLANKTLPSEFGFQYSAANNWYTPYYRTASPKGYQYATLSLNKFVHYAPGQTVSFGFGTDTIDNQPYLHVAVLGKLRVGTGLCTIIGSVAQTDNCMAHGHFPDANWSGSKCCIFGRMTTIAQSNPFDAYYDGADFGPIAWSDAELAATPPSPAPSSTVLPIAGNQSPWTQGGEPQDWPPDQFKVVGTDVSATGETDTIDLSKLPPIALTMVPSQQTIIPGSTHTYTANVTNVNGAPPLFYGWVLVNPFNEKGDSLSVPLAVKAGVFLVSPSNSATLTIGNVQGPYKLDVRCDVFFYNAAGKLTDLWSSPWDANGGFARADAAIQVGLKEP